MHRQRLPLILVALSVLLGGTIVYAPRARGAEECFAETNQCIRGRFLDYWAANGGLARNGFPLTEERREVLEDGNEYTVQYFERVRLEYHPENRAPYDVLLGQFGRRILLESFRGNGGAYINATGAVAPLPDGAFFAETGHNVGGRFLAYWQANGRLPQFGFPITEEIEERLEDGRVYRVQYFERARFEHHPENDGSVYEVLLGQFGRAIAIQADLLDSGFGFLYITNEDVRERLGPPQARARQVQGATQAFERGRMFYRGDLRHIYALAGGAEGRRLDVGSLVADPQLNRYFSDTWAEGQEIGGGPAPEAGRYYPQRGFGKVWREHQPVQDYLGYALTADEAGYTMLVQEFDRGVLLSSPEGPVIYMVVLQEYRACKFCGPAELRGYFERFEGRAP